MSSAMSPVRVIALGLSSHLFTKSRTAAIAREVRFNPNWRMMMFNTPLLLVAARLMSSRACLTAFNTAEPFSILSRTCASPAFLSSRGMALMPARSFSGSMANCGKDATRNRLALSFIETTAPRHAKRSRASGVSMTSMFSMAKGMPCSASSATISSRWKCWR